MKRHPIADLRLVLQTPGMEKVVVDRNVLFGADGASHLRMDVYRPGAEADAALPVVVFVTGYSDSGSPNVLGCALKDMASYVDWARLIASAGMVAITYENEDPVRDLDRLLRHIRLNAAQLGIDPERIGLWSCSGNVPNALALLHAGTGIRCAALCYGYMVDVGGSNDVARAAAQWGFVNPIGIVDFERFAPVPILIAKAGRDEMPGLNASIDRFVAAAHEVNLPVAVVSQPAGQHAFDVKDDTNESRAVIRQIVDFLHRHLSS